MQNTTLTFTNTTTTMPKEIERKFLTTSDHWKNDVTRTIPIKQGYLSTDPSRSVRIRITGAQAYLTVKGLAVGITRPEYEYEIPVADALEMIELCEQPVIEKTRYLVADHGKTWEVDVFSGANEGLTVAELELGAEAEEFTLPDWAGEEVTNDLRYFNSSLNRMPFSRW